MRVTVESVSWLAAEGVDSGDRVLARRIAAGDAATLDRFFDVHVPKLYAFVLRRCGDPNLADEIVQRTCLLALERLGSFRGEASLFTWICAIARNELARAGRMRSREALGMDEEAIERVLREIETRRLTEEDFAALQESVGIALTSLPPHYQDALRAKYLDGLSLEEIGKKIDASPQAAGALLVRARDAFKRAFRDALRKGDA